MIILVVLEIIITGSMLVKHIVHKCSWILSFAGFQKWNSWLNYSTYHLVFHHWLSHFSLINICYTLAFRANYLQNCSNYLKTLLLPLNYFLHFRTCSNATIWERYFRRAISFVYVHDKCTIFFLYSHCSILLAK